MKYFIINQCVHCVEYMSRLTKFILIQGRIIHDFQQNGYGKFDIQSQMQFHEYFITDSCTSSKRFISIQDKIINFDKFAPYLYN